MAAGKKKGKAGAKNKPVLKAPSSSPRVSSGPESGKSIESEKKGAQARLKELKEETLRKKITEETEEALEDDRNLRDVLYTLVGSTFVASLLVKITKMFSGDFDPDDVRKRFNETAEEIAKKKINIEDYIVAHRSLGYGRNRPNSREAIISALQGGEQQLEVDIRAHNGKLYLSHDPISKRKDKDKMVPLEEALDLFARYGKKDANGSWPTIFLDIKEKGLVKKVDSLIAKVDKKQLGPPISNRNIVNSFDLGILKEANESNSRRPLIYYYIPTKKITGLSTLLSVVGFGGAKKLLSSIDSAAGTTFSHSLNNVELTNNGKSLGKSPKGADRSFNLWDELPPKNILDMVANTNGYICVPPQLLTKSLIKAAHNRKPPVKVAVWGAENDKIKKMINEYKVDLVISDTPDIVKNKPVEMT